MQPRYSHWQHKGAGDLLPNWYRRSFFQHSLKKSFPGGASGKRTHLPMQEKQETQGESLGREDLLENMATHSSIPAQSIPWTKESGGLQSVGRTVGHD